VLYEKEIINGCKKYHKDAQKALYEKYAPMMYGICIRYASRENEVKDILQEGFLKVFSQINSFKELGSFEGWIKRIIVNHSINYYHKNRKHYKHLDIDNINESEIFYDSSDIEDITIDKNSISPRELNQDNITAEIIEKAGFTHKELLEILNRLPEPFRLVFNLHCIEHYKHDEIAELLKIDIGTSRTRLLRARKIIREMLCEMSVLKLSHEMHIEIK
jgi:RNA polymerase sigma-70 factor, ECF subfamily